MHTFLEWQELTEGPAAVLQRVISHQDLGTIKSHLKRVMPRHKVNHSLRVGATMVKAGGTPSAVKAALFHDYMERGGAQSRMSHLGDTKTKKMVRALSSTQKNGATKSQNEPLDHIQHVLDKPIHPDLKNHIILIKLADRLDNLKKRANAGGVGKKYHKKSKDLVKYLSHHYSGNKDHIRKLGDHFATHGIKIKT